MAWRKKELSDGILFWDNEQHKQATCPYEPTYPPGGISLTYKGKKYTGCWSSRPSVVRELADPSFVGRGEYIDEYEGKVWHLFPLQGEAKSSEEEKSICDVFGLKSKEVKCR